MARVPRDVFGLVGTTVVGAFRVEAVVAEGGFAVVYRAYHSGFRADVALKCLKIPQYLSAEDQERFERQFQAEAELLFKLSALTPHVVRPLHVEAVDAPDGTFMPFLALEWLEGETLDSIIERRREGGWPPLSIDEIVDLLEPVALALDRAHHFEGPDGPISIVHRDMKPENIFVATVGGERIVKILDFGIGKARSVATQVAGRLTQNDGELSSFTPAYGAPEQWSPKRYGQTGPWTDVWGLAICMVELLVGRPVIDGDQAAMMSAALDEKQRPTPRSEGVRVGDAVEAFFERALAVDPRSRFADAGELWRALLDARASDSRTRPARFEVTTERAEPVEPARQNGELEFDLDELSHGGEGPTPAPEWAGPEAPPWEPPRDEAALSSSDRWEARLRELGRRTPTTSSSQGDSKALRDGALRPPAATDALRAYMGPALFIGAGLLLAVGDTLYAATTGEVLAIGPLRLAWCAGGVLLAGIGLVARRFVKNS